MAVEPGHDTTGGLSCIARSMPVALIAVGTLALGNLAFGGQATTAAEPSPVFAAGLISGLELAWTTAVQTVLIAGLIFFYIRERARHACESAELERRVRTAVELIELERKEKLLLDEIIHKINTGIGLSEILEFVFDSFQPLIPYDRIGFALMESDGSVLRTHWSRSSSGRIRLGVGYSAPIANSSLDGVLRTGVPRILNDLPGHLEKNPASESTRLIVAEGMRSSLTCPLVANGKPIGFLFFSSRAFDAYRQVHVERFMRIAQRLSLIVEKGRCYEETARTNARLAMLMDDMLPPSIHQQLVPGKEELLAESIDDATILFADLVGFSSWSSQIRPERVVGLLNKLFSSFDRLVRRHGLCKIGTQGDSYLVLGGAPIRRPNHLESAASLAIAMQRVLGNIRQTESLPVTARIGIHVGHVVAGVIGRLVHRYDAWGGTVNMASRLESTADPGTIQVSEPVYVRLRARFILEERGLVELKGFGPQRTYWLVGRKKRE
ncbi:MAG TPA: adenylate/guanylate cyclase domain-containing protein [Verrucomicrobiota bacterium]|nr:adenylate/guanylate cyclase domain-containing protein [Verrucomicrobiota bacterium]